MQTVCRVTESSTAVRCRTSVGPWDGKVAIDSNHPIGFRCVCFSQIDRYTDLSKTLE
jgi:hypothetical protein